MPETTTSAAQREGAAREQLKQREPAPEAKKTPEIPHAIETYYVGMPGSEKLVANTADSEQVGVHYFEGDDVIGVERQAIAQSERDAIASLKDKPAKEMGRLAKDATVASSLEAKDMGTIMELLKQKRDLLLTVDADTITNPSIPKEALHLIIKKTEMEKLKPHVEGLGYTTREVQGSRLEATKGHSRLVFLYAKEGA